MLRIGFYCLLITSIFSRAQPLIAAESPSDLEWQVAGLNTLNDLDVTAEQLQNLQTMSADTAGDATAIDIPNDKNGVEYHAAMIALRDALVSGDDDKIGDAQDTVDMLRDKFAIDLVLPVHLTDTARVKARPAMRALTTSQIAGYIAVHSDDVPDAYETINDALEECKDGSQADFASLRDEAAQQVAVLAAGVDAKLAATVNQKVADLLDQARRMNARQFANRRGELDRNARQITRTIDPFEAIHHWMMWEMGKLLSNPQIGKILELRLAAENKVQ